MIDLRPCSIDVVRDLVERFHGYRSMGRIMSYCFAVYEDDKPVAAFAWVPPAPGAAKAVCPFCPDGVLALSRMVAIPKSERRLKHISKPLRMQMTKLIDRTRYPVLITYSDEGMGHTGHVYKCSGWQKTIRTKMAWYENDRGQRQSKYCNGGKVNVELTKGGVRYIQRWEHHTFPPGLPVALFGWRREPIPGKVWRSGNQAFRIVKDRSDRMVDK